MSLLAWLAVPALPTSVFRFDSELQEFLKEGTKVWLLYVFVGVGVQDVVPL